MEISAQKFIEMVEEMANVDSIYHDPDVHPSVVQDHVNEAIADAFKKSKAAVSVLQRRDGGSV